MEFAHKNIRLRPENYRGTRLIFIALCCEARKCVFENRDTARWLVDCLREEAEANRFAVHAFCVMPDHLHALVQGFEPSSDLLRFLKILKQKTAFQYQQRSGKVLWQKKFLITSCVPRIRVTAWPGISRGLVYLDESCAERPLLPRAGLSVFLARSRSSGRELQSPLVHGTPFGKRPRF
jgi:REP element-mobilizing transposase RayT